MRPETYFKGTMRFKKDGEALVTGADNGIYYTLRRNINGNQFIDGEVTDFHVVIRSLQASKRFEDKLDLYKIAKHKTYNRQEAWFHNEKNPSIELELIAGNYIPVHVDEFKLMGSAISALGVDLENLPSDEDDNQYVDLLVTIEQYLTPLEKLGKNYADKDAAATVAPIAGSFGGSGNIADKVVEYDKNLSDRFAKKVVLCHLEPPFEDGEEDNRTQAYQALKNFIESEANDRWWGTPIGRHSEGLPITQVVSGLWQLRLGGDQLSSSEKAAYLAFSNIIPQYGVILEMTDGRKFDIPPVRYRSGMEGSRRQNPYGTVELVNEIRSETSFAGDISIIFRGDVEPDHAPHYVADVEIIEHHNCVFNGTKWELKDEGYNIGLSMYSQYGDHIKSVDIYVIQ